MEQKLEIPIWVLKLQSKFIKVKNRSDNLPAISFIMLFIIEAIYLWILSFSLPTSISQSYDYVYILSAIPIIIWLISIVFTYKKFISDVSPTKIEKLSYYFAMVGIEFNKLLMDRKLNNRIRQYFDKLSATTNNILNRELNDFNHRKLKEALFEFKHTINKLNTISKNPSKYKNLESKSIGTNLLEIGSFLSKNQIENVADIINVFNMNVSTIETRETTFKEEISEPINKFKELSDTNQLIIISGLFFILYSIFPSNPLIVVMFTAIFGAYFKKIFIDKNEK